jgi:hypothetical protein
MLLERSSVLDPALVVKVQRVIAGEGRDVNAHLHHESADLVMSDGAIVQIGPRGPILEHSEKLCACGFLAASVGLLRAFLA